MRERGTGHLYYIGEMIKAYKILEKNPETSWDFLT